MLEVFNIMAIKKLSPRLVCSLSVISDPRKEKNQKHLLIDILVIALCTCLAGGEGWTDCEDYVLALKKNQPSLYEQVDDFFSTAEEFNFEDIEYEDYETVEKDHGRIEIRKYTLVTDVQWLEKKGWTGLKSVGRVIRERRANGKVSRETVYHISSLSGKAKTYANAVRKHWGVENKLHWCLDVIFNEDQCRMRAEFSAQNYSALRRVAIFNRDKSKDLSMRRKRLKAAWSNNYIQTLIFS